MLFFIGIGVVLTAIIYRREWRIIFSVKSVIWVLISGSAILLSSYFFPMVFSYATPIISSVGLLFFYCGISLIWWAKHTMQSSWGVPGTKPQGTLITTGPFRFSRNPIYIGASLGLFGFALSLLSPLFFLAVIPLYIHHKAIRIEEKHLLKKFGDDYRAYMNRVPRYL